MIFTRQNFSERQPKVTVCASGRAMIALNEQVVNAVECTPVTMTEDGEEHYEKREREQYAYDVCWLDGVGDQGDVLAAAKKAVTDEIVAYDQSPAVNGFILNGAKVWLDKATRVGLMNSTSIAKAMGQQTTTLWLGDVKIEVDCDKAIQLLSALEMYAIGCFNVTAAHKKAVAEMNFIESVLLYNYTVDYPEMLTMSV